MAPSEAKLGASRARSSLSLSSRAIVSIGTSHDSENAHPTGNLQRVVARERASQSEKEHAQHAGRRQRERRRGRVDGQRMSPYRRRVANCEALQEHVGLWAEPADGVSG